MKNLAIILVNYKQPDLTIDCIKSIRRSDIQNYSIIVVDNNSKDNSYEIFGKEEGIVLILLNENNGFAAGNNVGIQYAIDNGYTDVLLLNNDTIIDEQMISMLMHERDTNSVLVPKMYYFDEPEKIWYAGGYIDYHKAKAIHEKINMIDYIDRDHEVDFVTGCCILIPISVIQKVGFFDERFFMYGEDVDYSLRLKKSGIKMKYISSAKLWHKVGGSIDKQSPLNAYYDTRNRLIIMSMYQFGFVSYVYFYITRIIRIIQNCLKKNMVFKYLIKGIFDFHSGIYGKVELF